MKQHTKTAAKQVAAKPARQSIRVTKTLSLDHETYEAVKRKCAEEGQSVSSLIDELLAAWLEAVGAG